MNDIRLAGVRSTLLMTLKAKALGNRLEDPILADPYAEEVMRAVEADYETKADKESQLGLIAAIRARTFDDWARQFLAQHPDAVVLHLGCGLDSRVYRLDPGTGVDWYDLDYPDIIALRERFYPERAHYTMVGSSVTDMTWLNSIPTDRPVLAICEGLLEYLEEAQVKRLVTAVADRFPSGQLICDVVPRWARWFSRYDPNLRKVGAVYRWGIDDPADLADWHSKLRYLGEASLTGSPLVAKAPRNVRRLYRMMEAVPFIRRSTRLVHYSF